ncbi:hypothetical protein V2J09_006275 [Rumex salicifolius]
MLMGACLGSYDSPWPRNREFEEDDDEYYQIPDELKVEVASMHLEGDALDLFARITGNTEILYWEEIDKINKFLAYKRQGKSFNSEVRNRKDYRNPDFLLHAVSYQGIDQIGSCFSKDVFDPHGYDERDFYDAIEVDMKLEMERKEQEKKKSPKVDFVTGGTQQAVVLPAARNTISVSVDAVSRDSRQNKKSKWDKVDGDQKIALGGGQVAQTSVGAHASFLSAANPGSGYAMFINNTNSRISAAHPSCYCSGFESNIGVEKQKRKDHPKGRRIEDLDQ